MSNRKKIPDEVQKEVLTRSRRRCCLCYGLNRDADIKQGQIAHLDQDNSNERPDNLVFLCLAHHDQYDSRTSQSKGFTLEEAKEYRSELYSHVQAMILRNVLAPTTQQYSATEEQDALSFHTSSHRLQAAVHELATGQKWLQEINNQIPPHDLKWTSAVLSDAIDSGWVRRTPGNYWGFQLTLNGTRMLEVLDLLPDSLKEEAWKAVWSSETRMD